MATSGFGYPAVELACFVVLLFHLPSTTFGSELLSIQPFSGDLCKDVSCGKGNCTLAKNSSVPFECVCEPGWRQPPSVHGFHFLPCLVPNCTIDVSCSKATSPTIASNGSIFNPCSWNICGGGTCQKKSSSNPSYSCSCKAGFKNLLNSTTFPCYPECALGGDCPKSIAPAPSHSAENSSNQGRSVLRENLSWFKFLAIIIIGHTITLL